VRHKISASQYKVLIADARQAAADEEGQRWFARLLAAVPRRHCLKVTVRLPTDKNETQLIARRPARPRTASTPSPVGQSILPVYGPLKPVAVIERASEPPPVCYSAFGAVVMTKWLILVAHSGVISEIAQFADKAHCMAAVNTMKQNNENFKTMYCFDSGLPWTVPR
jgi:hypothetical protein